MDGEHYFDKPYFFKKDVFLRLLDCNGQNDMEADRAIRELVKAGVIEESESRPETLMDYCQMKISADSFILTMSQEYEKLQIMRSGNIGNKKLKGV